MTPSTRQHVRYPLTEQHLVTILDQGNWSQSTQIDTDDEGQAVYRTGFLVSVASTKAHQGRAGLNVTLRVADADRAIIPTTERNDVITAYASTLRAAGLTVEIEAPNGWGYPILLWVPIQELPESLAPASEAAPDPVIWADYPLDDVVSTFRPSAAMVRALASTIQSQVDTLATYGRDESRWHIAGILQELRPAPRLLRADAKIRSADQRRKALLDMYAHARRVLSECEAVLAAIDTYIATGEDSRQYNVAIMVKVTGTTPAQYRDRAEGTFIGLEMVATHLHHLLGIMTRAEVAAEDAASVSESANTPSDPH